MEAPEKIYLTSDEKNSYVFTRKRSDNEGVEYTRTDTFIKKACEWFENYLFDLGYPDDWCRDSPNIESGKERFIKAMKGE